MIVKSSIIDLQYMTYIISNIILIYLTHFMDLQWKSRI